MLHRESRPFLKVSVSGDLAGVEQADLEIRLDGGEWLPVDVWEPPAAEGGKGVVKKLIGPGSTVGEVDVAGKGFIRVDVRVTSSTERPVIPSGVVAVV